MTTNLANNGLQMLRDAMSNGADDMVTLLYGGAAVVTVLAALMVRNALNTAKYRR